MSKGYAFPVEIFFMTAIVLGIVALAIIWFFTRMGLT